MCENTTKEVTCLKSKPVCNVATTSLAYKQNDCFAYNVASSTSAVAKLTRLGDGFGQESWEMLQTTPLAHPPTHPSASPTSQDLHDGTLET